MLNRRQMLIASVSGSLASLAAQSISDGIPIRDGIPRVDYHVHIGDAISVDRAIELSQQRGVKFGLLQHAGVKGHGYAVSDDEQLLAWIKSLEGKPVFVGIEGEGIDWPSAFSAEALARLDYAQSDPLGMPDRSGQVLKLWTPGFRYGNVQEFMDRYTDFHVQLISTLPINILAVPTFLPAVFRPDYNRLWTPKRSRTIIDAALKHRVAIEIDCRFRVPGFQFLEMAKDAGTKFAFGSNYQTAEGIGDISYCVEAYQRLRLTTKDLFRPAP